MRVSGRKFAGGLLIVAGIVALTIPFFLFYQTQPVITPAPPAGGNGHGGKSAGGGTTPPCTTNCAGLGPADAQPPTTTMQTTGQTEWTRNGIPYFYPSITIVLHSTDDQNLATILLNDTGTITEFPAYGQTSDATSLITSTGLHTISYYSIDQAGNKEKPHLMSVGLSKPNLSDLQSIITNSNIDNAGIKNAMLAKITTAMAELASNQSPNSLNSISHQLRALDGKHGLDQATVDLLQSMIRSILS